MLESYIHKQHGERTDIQCEQIRYLGDKKSVFDENAFITEMCYLISCDGQSATDFVNKYN